LATKNGVKRSGIVSSGLLLLAIPLYFIYRSNLHYEWLFNLTAALGMILLIFRVFGPLAFTYFTKHVPGFLNDNLTGNRLFRTLFIIQDGD
jgi:hypothetical protein